MLASKPLIIDLAGAELSPEERTALRQQPISGICLFRRNLIDLEQSQALLQDVQQTVGRDILIAVDQEGGAVSRIPYLPQPPSAMALAAVGDAHSCELIGAAVARGLAAIGINWNFAPVLDLNSNPNNPVIAERSFGVDPQQVSHLALAWQRGHKAEGVATCIKHFPGHGDTVLDSHHHLPRVDKRYAELLDYELAPFLSALPQSPAIMSSHILFDALDTTQPATLSYRILTQLLREQYGYQGVIVTDAMNMRAITQHNTQAAACAQALSAGADLVLAFGSANKLQNTVATIQQMATISPDAQQRIHHLIQTFPSQIRPYTRSQQQQDSCLMATLWQRALTAYRQPQRPPLGKPLRVLIQQSPAATAISEAGVDSAKLLQRFAQYYPLEVIPFDTVNNVDPAYFKEKAYTTLLVSTQRKRYQAAQVQHWQPDLHLVLWNPYCAFDIQAPAIISYGFAAAAIDALFAWLTGKIEANGTFPGIKHSAL